ncbi:hypothetical protein Bca52824_001879 [Brassica carinata]|uniref:Uncharacterized protein n=1 Tax=Brassica carinata TaxID=52824 RepID=A0A8X8BA41_BRACI|nr:hypothetical protein Bca52824_001879 [Brassica carinata]
MVVSVNPFAVLQQDEDPPSLQENSCHVEVNPPPPHDDSKLSLVVSSSVNSQSSPSQCFSKPQKSKKRKLAKRSPVSSGSPPLSLGERNPQ